MLEAELSMVLGIGGYMYKKRFLFGTFLPLMNYFWLIIKKIHLSIFSSIKFEKKRIKYTKRTIPSNSIPVIDA